jgi:hypothetical protein
MGSSWFFGRSRLELRGKPVGPENPKPALPPQL